MSKLAAKIKGDKGANRGVAVVVPVIAPVVNSDIVPGRMTVPDWGKICSADDDNEFITSLVEEILETTMGKCYDAYISKKVVPYTVFKAKDDLLRIIQWRFMNYDVGEADTRLDQGWAEDVEPETGIIDSWAQGSVPVVVKKGTERKKRRFTKKLDKHANGQQSLEDTLGETVTFETGMATCETTEISDSELKDTDTTEQEQKQIKKILEHKKHSRKPPSSSTMDLTLENSESQLFARELSDLYLKQESGAHYTLSQRSLLKLQAEKPPGDKDAALSEKGNVMDIVKLDPKRLPTHKVRVSYTIVDPEAEAATQRLEAMRTGKLKQLAQIHWKPKPRRTRISPRPAEDEQQAERTRPLHPTPPLPRRNARLTADRFRGAVQTKPRIHIRSKYMPRSLRKDEDNPSIEPLPPSLIDSIDVSPGVVITEGEQVKGGTKLLRPLIQAPILSEDGTILGSVSVSTKGSRTLRFLGAPTASSSDRSLIHAIRPILSPSRVIGCSEPHVSSPFSVSRSVGTPQTNSFASLQ